MMIFFTPNVSSRKCRYLCANVGRQLESVRKKSSEVMTSAVQEWMKYFYFVTSILKQLVSLQPHHISHQKHICVCCLPSFHPANLSPRRPTPSFYLLFYFIILFFGPRAVNAQTSLCHVRQRNKHSVLEGDDPDRQVERRSAPGTLARAARLALSVACDETSSASLGPR